VETRGKIVVDILYCTSYMKKTSIFVYQLYGKVRTYS